MSTISSCPRCQRQVSIPAGVDSQAEVRCPLCDAEYPLSEALALTPPELIPVLSAVRQESALTPGRSEALAAVDRGEASEPVATIPFGGAVESAETLTRRKRSRRRKR